jgi:1-acyl-sn-glycerol-3-phosphate acyltransferase
MLVSTDRSLLLSLRNVYATLSVSATTLVHAFRGTATRALCDERLEAWASQVVANSEMMISVQGREHVVPGTTYLIMSNHQSHYDIAVIYYVLGSTIRMVAKRELFELPVFGRALNAAGFIAVDRQNHRAAIASMEGVKTKLAAGIPIWIAPEGTRSTNGELLPFKMGGFVLAAKTGTPILPVSIRGTREILRAKGVRTRAGVQVFVTIHPPIDPKQLPRATQREARDSLAEQTRLAIASGL